jgi:DNA-binding HxlR family transcriptional regulator
VKSLASSTRTSFEVEIPITPDLGLFGRKWTARILANIGFREVTRFNQLLRANPGLTRRMLSRRLHDLEREGFVSKTDLSLGTRHVVWLLTPKGRELLPVLMQLIVFGSKSNLPYRFEGEVPWLGKE